MARKGRLGTGNRSSGWYGGFYPPSVPKKAKGGVALTSRHGEIGSTWWSRRWIEVLESFGWASRLQRGRRYARQGQVTELHVTGKGATAKVQGSRPEPYKVTISLDPITPAEWARLGEALRKDLGLVAQLLAGQVPEGIEPAFSKAGLVFLPRSAKDLRTECSCPDTANPCKHIAAVHYLLAERFDQDPFLIFVLRGKSKEDVMEALSSFAPPPVQEIAQGTPGAPEMVDHKRADLLDYWKAGPRISAAECTPHPPTMDLAIMRRLGDPMFCHQSQWLVMKRTLAKAYATVSERALAASRGEGPTPTAEEKIPVEIVPGPPVEPRTAKRMN
jgi:uncharacterized Zn finger protein